MLAPRVRTRYSWALLNVCTGAMDLKTMMSNPAIQAMTVRLHVPGMQELLPARTTLFAISTGNLACVVVSPVGVAKLEELLPPSPPPIVCMLRMRCAHDKIRHPAGTLVVRTCTARRRAKQRELGGVNRSKCLARVGATKMT